MTKEGKNQPQDDDDSSSSFDMDLDDDNEKQRTTIKDQAAVKTKKTLARKETQAVSLLRYVFVLVLLATAIAVSLATFYYARRVEDDAFQSEFDNVAIVTQRSFVEAVENRLHALDALATGITSHARDAGETFPNVTVPDWEVKGGTLRTQTDGIYLFWLPLVTDETRAGYEAYTKMMQGHLFQSYGKEEMLRQYQDLYFNMSKPTPEASEKEETEHSHDDHDHEHRQLHVGDPPPGPDFHPVIHDGIWGLNPTKDENGTETWIEQPNTGPYLVCWQLSPIIPLPGLLNFNFFNYGDLKPMLEQVLLSEKTTLGGLQTKHDGSNTEDLINVFLTLNQYRHEQETYIARQDPMTHVAYPVFDSTNPMTRNVTGVALTTILWRLLLNDILAENIRGVIVVLKNTLGESTTYRIDGQTASLVGTGDLHDPNYNDMGVTRHLRDYLAQRANPKRWSYTSVELDDGYTSYSIHVYPSKEMEDQYVTNDPVVYAVMVGAIFVFTTLVFILYDWLVERRQAKVMDKAVKSTAVVTSLFPEAVHDRLFADPSKSEEFSKEMAWKNNNHAATTEAGTSVEMLMRQSATKKPPSRATSRGRKGKPIADKFDDVTVLFADLAGFTQWSSTRDPEQVFELLEACYGAFDAIALRRHVFKVETIGDCYMACTGLPNPQADHAPRMVKFARDCMARMQRLLEEDLEHLGADTRNLGFRVGMHSGPVTAGVLRGDKGRFQLFGDTVNTASRMESNGVMGRIHCSSSTAALLPERWLTPREDKIVAKGKGEMQTYWVEATSRAQSSVGGWSSQGGGSSEDVDNGGGSDVDEEELVQSKFAKRLSLFQPLRNSLGVNMNFEEELEVLRNEVEVFKNEVEV